MFFPPRRLPTLLRVAGAAFAGLLAAGCADLAPRPQPRVAFSKSQWTHAPPWARDAIRQDWWTEFRDPQLNRHVTAALRSNAELAVLGARLAQADAQTLQARAAGWPAIGLGAGYREGREQVRDTAFRPVDLKPWTASAQASWEIDITGKLRAATRSARDARQAAFYDYHAARLLVASQVAEAHFRILRLRGEQALLRESVRANRGILETLRQRREAGIASTTEVRRQEAEHERLERALLDLERLGGLASIQLGTLLGSGRPVPAGASVGLDAVHTPPLPARTTSEVLRHRPDLLAAEARVRSAFQREEAARLALLPSLHLGAAASGAAGTLTTNFRSWIATVGPTLEIPVWDPQRLAAVRVRRAATNESAALYRRVALQAFEEVEAAYLNVGFRIRELAAARREVEALEEARRNTLATFNAGLVSQIELLESERRSLEARRQALAVQHSLLRDRLALVRALGGA
ncbi:MAG: TolC family protein [Akkermansiaceae bacterium]|nr:TolC family protein [Akkermansiaceae bacterium]